VIETPVLDARKWAKLPSIPSDAVLVDMEDSVPSHLKEEGRRRVAEVVADPGPIADRVVIGRPNHLSTPWGQADVVALARAGVGCMMYPKVRSVGEVHEVQRLLRDEGADPDLVICIETPQAVAHVEAIAAVERVVGLSFGEGDLSADLDIAIHLPDGSLNPALLPARVRTIVAAAAADIVSFDFAILRDIKDPVEFRGRVTDLVALGAKAICTVYPPHVDIVNDVLTPSAEEIDRARDVVQAMDQARADGSPAVVLEDGRALLIHDYTKACTVLRRAGVPA
jgi:citrate lyase beta subunit